MISEPMAVALNYGMFRRKEVNATARNILFYDMGAHDTTVRIIITLSKHGDLLPYIS